jgi:hypothetical protein
MFSLTLALAPPPGKTRQHRAERKSREYYAQVISDKIDEDIKRERLALRKQQKNTIRVLLLGQSESGKSRSLPAYHITLVYYQEIYDLQKYDFVCYQTQSMIDRSSSVSYENSSP